MKKNYQELKLEIAFIESQDVITTSNYEPGVDADNIGEWQWDAFYN